MATTLAPGPTPKFEECARMYPSKAFPTIGTMGVTTVATRGYNALMRGDRVEVPGIRNKVIAAPRRVTSPNTLAKISKKSLEQRK